jgi:putative methyltransferase (TIGR04325 family)
MSGGPDLLQRVYGFVRTSAAFRALRRRRLERAFLHGTHVNLFRGVFASFEQAAAAAPGTRPIGYDNPDAAAMYRDRLSRVQPNDWPVLFWLCRALRPGSHVLDYGGHVGIAYHAWQRQLAGEAWSGTRWTVYDVPSVVEAGRRLAAERGTDRLDFVNDPRTAGPYDVVLFAGSLQYVEQPTSALLATLAHRPTHVLVNKTPLTEHEGFVTLSAMGTAHCPYAVRNRNAFEKDMLDAGYALVDAWDAPDLRCEPLDRPDLAVSPYRGFYFRSLRDDAR